MVVRVQFEVEETAVTVVAEPQFVKTAKDSIFDTREIIKRFIRQDPFFLHTLEPYIPPSLSPPIIVRMCEAAGKAGVGPMATVAGVIADEAVSAMVKAGAGQAIVDNGGDIALHLTEPEEVGLYAGESKLTGLGFHCEPREDAFGICTSSGTVGPSISFGIADAATVVSGDVTLADACATLLGNLVGSRKEEVLRQARETVCSISGVEGAMVVVGGSLAMKGSLPELTESKVSMGRIAKRRLVF